MNVGELGPEAILVLVGEADICACVIAESTVRGVKGAGLSFRAPLPLYDCPRMSGWGGISYLEGSPCDELRINECRLNCLLCNERLVGDGASDLDCLSGSDSGAGGSGGVMGVD